jgi:hypothetical protein
MFVAILPSACDDIVAFLKASVYTLQAGNLASRQFQGRPSCGE